MGSSYSYIIRICVFVCLLSLPFETFMFETCGDESSPVTKPRDVVSSLIMYR